jgi:hypothetical protein
MAKRNYKYWHIVANGFGYSVMVFPDRVVFPNEPDIPTLKKANATRYDVRKYIIERPWVKRWNNVRENKGR